MTQDDRKMRWNPTKSVALVLLLLGWQLCRPTAALDFNAVAIIYWTAVETLTTESDNLEQSYSIRLRQEITPFVSAQASYRYYDYTSQFTGLPEASRTRQNPRFQILYNRPVMTANLGYERRTSTGTFESDDFEADSLFSGFSWRATRGLTLSGQARRSTNATDVSALGRDIDQQIYVFDINYRRAQWTLGYSYNRNDLDNQATGFSSLQDVHRFRLAGGHNFLDNRLSLGVTGSVGRIDRDARSLGDDDFAEPVPAVQGLFAIDTSPEVGELESTPGLVDGDFLTPSPPIIDIGGSNAFRNVGVDVGLILPISRLEVAVDRPSGPAVQWLAFHSADNLIWERIGGEAASFDAGRQIYRVDFPETTDRFFKVVNVSPNAAPLVLVTEVSAFRRLDDPPEEIEEESTLYRGEVSLGFRPTRRVWARMNLGGSNDETIAAGIVRRDFNERHASGGLGVFLTPHLELSGGYRYSESENRGAGELFRTTETVDAGLRWTPMATVDASFVASRRDEKERELLLQTIDTVRFSLFTALLPELDLTSRLTYSELADPIGNQDRNTWSWREELRSRPTRRWVLDAAFGYSLTETPLQEELLDRKFVNARSTWNPGANLFLDGGWSWSQDNDRTTIGQIYGVSYTPGPKLMLNLAYNQTNTEPDRKTSGQAVSASYRLNPRVHLSGSWTRSEVTFEGDLTSRTDSLLFGLSVFFY